ncbi:MAG: hypothetical protein KAW17_08575, partial [Candidatus Eisenbacteria sp.]|nr:hypothetical protein [Candidatus Eisenbacteria bacterium]
ATGFLNNPGYNRSVAISDAENETLQIPQSQSPVTRHLSLGWGHRPVRVTRASDQCRVSRE